MKIEVNRWFASPKAFFNYARKKLGEKADDCAYDYEQWANPIQKSSTREHDETCVLQPFETHLYFKNSYNFIMEYDFYDDTHGFGYMYLEEK